MDVAFGGPDQYNSQWIDLPVDGSERCMFVKCSETRLLYLSGQSSSTWVNWSSRRFLKNRVPESAKAVSGVAK